MHPYAHLSALFDSATDSTIWHIMHHFFFKIKSLLAVFIISVAYSNPVNIIHDIFYIGSNLLL